MNATKLPIQTESNKSKLAVAHSALKKATQSKRTYSVEDYDLFDKSVFVSYYDQDNNWTEDTILKAALYVFIESHYRDQVDVFQFGEHEQYTDTLSAHAYFEENTLAVLTHFLNHKGYSHEV